VRLAEFETTEATENTETGGKKKFYFSVFSVLSVV